MSRVSKGKLKSEAGSILYVVLWSLVILSLLAISLSRRNNVDLALIKYSVRKLRAKSLAWAGIIYAMDQVQQDSRDAISQKIDNLNYCGIPIDENRTAEDLFRERNLHDGHFSVQNKERYGLADEERKINLNSLTKNTISVLKELLILLDIDQTKANQISYSLLDWIDSNKRLSQENYGAENSYYEGLANPYRCKNLPLDSIEELFLVRGMTKEVFEQLTPYVTVYPKGPGALKINFDTASEIVLKALARGVSENATNTDISDADSLARKMIECRNRGGHKENSFDDGQIRSEDMNLNSREKIIFNIIRNYRTEQSQYFRALSVGVEGRQNIKAEIEVVFRRQDLSIIYSQQF